MGNFQAFCQIMAPNACRINGMGVNNVGFKRGNFSFVSLIQKKKLDLWKMIKQVLEIAVKLTLYGFYTIFIGVMIELFLENRLAFMKR